MDRDRDRRFDDRRGGESYRPSDRLGRSPSRGYIRSTRSPPRNRSPRPVADTWVPSKSNRLRSRSPAFRRRSRSPSFRDRDTGAGHFQHRGRTRSPSRKFSPRRDERPRSPLRSSWRSRSPRGRGRSPRASRARTPKRTRDPSSSVYDHRSPKRERLASPASDKYTRGVSPTRRTTIRDPGARRTYPTRSRSPVDRGRREPYPEGTFRRRSPSPSRPAPSAHTSSQGSAATSRLSSPSTHPDRLNLAPPEAKNRSPVSQSTLPRRDSRPSAPSSSHQEKSPLQESWPSRHEETRIASNEGEQPVVSMVETTRDSDINGASRAMQPQISSAPVQFNGAQPSRNPPSNPPNYATSQRVSPPSGPSNGPMSLYAQTRGSNISLLSAPTRPRGGPSFTHRDPARDANWAGAPSVRRGPAPPAPHGPPTGPRSGFAPAPSGHDTHRHASYRHSNSASTTYSRNQRFANHLSGLPSIIPGGKLLPSGLDSATEKRLAQLEADKEKLLEQIAEKQRVKRAGLRDWDRLDRESATGALKSELAEGHLQRMTEGESIGGSTAF